MPRSHRVSPATRRLSRPPTARTLGPWQPRSPTPAAPGRVRRWVATPRAVPRRPSSPGCHRPPPGAGCCCTSGSPRAPLWWLALPAFGLLGVTMHGRRARAGFGYGALFGLGFLLPLLRWTGIYVGPVPWLALSAAEARVRRGRGRRDGRGVAAARRARCGRRRCGSARRRCGRGCRSAASRGGASPSASPTGRCCPWRPSAGPRCCRSSPCSPALALGEAGRRLARREMRAAVVPALVALAALATGPLAALLPPAGSAPVRTVTIAAVQGNVPRLGLDFNAQRRAVLDNHVRVTEQLAADVAAGRRPRPDLVLWPENASDIDPLRNPDAAAAIDRAARAVGVPIVLGTVLAGPEDTATNSVLVWAARGRRRRPHRQAAGPALRGVPAVAAVLPAALRVRRPGGELRARHRRRGRRRGRRPAGDRDLLGDRLRRPGRRQRRRRGAGARRCRATTRRSGAAT